jgi:hypothetical protein
MGKYALTEIVNIKRRIGVDVAIVRKYALTEIVNVKRRIGVDVASVSWYHCITLGISVPRVLI